MRYFFQPVLSDSKLIACLLITLCYIAKAIWLRKTAECFRFKSSPEYLDHYTWYRLLRTPSVHQIAYATFRRSIILVPVPGRYTVASDKEHHLTFYQSKRQACTMFITHCLLLQYLRHALAIGSIQQGTLLKQ